MAKHPRKGVPGKKTGGKARKAINKAIKSGVPLKKIASATNRSVSTINQIKSGSIKNPPKNLIKAVKKTRK